VHSPLSPIVLALIQGLRRHGINSCNDERPDFGIQNWPQQSLGQTSVLLWFWNWDDVKGKTDMFIICFKSHSSSQSLESNGTGSAFLDVQASMLEAVGDYEYDVSGQMKQWSKSSAALSCYFVFFYIGSMYLFYLLVEDHDGDDISDFTLMDDEDLFLFELAMRWWFRFMIYAMF